MYYEFWVILVLMYEMLGYYFTFNFTYGIIPSVIGISEENKFGK